MALETDVIVVAASADNALASANQAAVAGKRWLIVGVIASFSLATASKLLSIIVGGVTIRFFVTNQCQLDFSTAPLRGANGAAVQATLAASGVGGTTGEVTLLVREG